MRLEWFFFTRYLISNRSYSLVSFINFLSFSSIFISVIILLLLLSVSNGFRLKLESSVLGFDPHIVVLCNKIGGDIKSVEENKIFNNANIESINFTFYSQVFLKSNKGFFSAFLKGSDFLDERLTKFTLDKSKRNFYKKDLYDKIPFLLIGDILSKKIGIIVGEIIYITPSILDGKSPTFLPFRVVGLLHSGIQYYDESLVYVNSKNCYNLFISQYTPKYMEIILKNISRIGSMNKKIKDSIGHKFLVKSLMQINADFFWALKMQKAVIVLILLVINIISTSIISASFLIMFLEKISEMSILKIIGLNNFKIRIIFAMRAIFVVIIACSFGYFFGLFACFLLKNLNIIKFAIQKCFFVDLPIYVSLSETFLIFLITIMFSLFFIFLSYLKLSSFQLKKEIYRK